MTRLADYFLVVGYNFEQSRNGTSHGKIVQRFPTKDWDDYPYECQIEQFCQPCGWFLTRSKYPPQFFIASFTSTEANTYYCACFNFHEAVSPQKLAAAVEAGVQSNGVGSASSSDVGRVVPSASSSSAALGCTDSVDSLSGGEGDQPQDPNLIRPAELYAQKCLVLLARHQHFDVLKNCLSIIYSVYVDSMKQCSLEHIIANILADIDVPPTGGPRLLFTVGAGDRQVLQPPVCSTLPVTKTCVAMLFKHLGIRNVIILFSAMLSDQNILVSSRSLTRLTDACHALNSLLYPLNYWNVYIPILPSTLLDMLSAPTPFLVGIHGSCRPHLPELTDVFIADLDYGSVYTPNIENAPMLSEPFNAATAECLTSILIPELLTADEVYPPEPGPPPDPAWQDKRLRAVFIRLFAQLFHGYRSCLVLTRINPKLVIDFNRNLFLLLRGLWDGDKFISGLLSTMAFNKFIETRGPPFRVCDVFDEEYSMMPELIKQERDNPEFVIQHIDRLAKKLYDNENCGQTVSHHLPPAASKAHLRIHQSPFPTLDAKTIEDNIKKNMTDRDKSKVYEQPEPRFVPHGPELDKKIFRAETLHDKSKVIREFVANIFNNHITEALKRRNTVRQDLKSRLIRRIFVDELYHKVHPDKEDPLSVDRRTSTLSGSGGGSMLDNSCALLSPEQFDLVVDLMEEALRQEEQSENSGVAPIIMDLSTTFCTQLNNLRYYANMTEQIQRHPVWETMAFWELAFNDQVNNQMRQLYIYQSEQIQLTQAKEKAPESRKRMASESGNSPYTTKMSTLAIAAEELKRAESHETENYVERIEALEVNTVCAQILHFLNLIVNFRLPLSIVEKKLRAQEQEFGETGGTGGAGGAVNVHPDSRGMNHRRQPSDHDSAAVFISKLEAWLKKFVDKVGSQNYLANNVIDNIKTKIEAVIEGHLLNLESIYPEVKSIPKFKKPEVTNPTLFPNEFFIKLGDRQSLRCQLLMDGRFERIDWQKLREGDPSLDPAGSLGVSGVGGPALSVQRPGNSGAAGWGSGDCARVGVYADEIDDPETIRPLLPAQGALFVTNYRIIFRGAPRDPYQSNKVVSRNFPIASLLPLDKPQTLRVAAHQSASGLKEESQVLVIKSTTMQLMKIGFDPDEVTPAHCEQVRERLLKLRYPAALEAGFNQPPVLDGASLPVSRSGVHLGSQGEEDGLGNLPYEDGSHGGTLEGNKMHRKETKTTTLRRAAKGTINSTMQLIRPRASSKQGRASPGSHRRTYPSQSDSERSSMVYEEERDVGCQVQMGVDPKSLERMGRLPGYMEYTRLNLVPPIGSGASPAHQMPPGSCLPNSYLKVVVNTRYQLVKSYPSMFVVPKDFSETHLALFAQTHRENRFPVVTWRHPRTGALLLRGAGFRSKNLLGNMFKQPNRATTLAPGGVLKGGDTVKSYEYGSKEAPAGFSGGLGMQSSESETSRSKQQEAYFRCLVDASPGPDDQMGDLLVPWDTSQTPRPHKKGIIDKAFKTLRHSGGKAKEAAFALRRSTSRGDSVLEEGSLKSGVQGQGADTISISTVNTSIVACDLRSALLYVLGEKADMKTLRKSEHFPHVEFVPVDFVSKGAMKESFSKLYQVCLPANLASVGRGTDAGFGPGAPGGPTASQAGQAGYTGSNSGMGGHLNTMNVGGSLGAGGSGGGKQTSKSFIADLQEGSWLAHLQNLLQLAGSVVDLMDIQAASVALCLEDGWDATSQIVSLAQVMMDPEYRTIRGFWALVEKDWCMFGHRFAQRSCQTNFNKSRTFAPVFLMFLDAVHQLLHQFPLAFEFNEFYLQFLAYHHVSNRFADFKCDREAERAGWLLNGPPAGVEGDSASWVTGSGLDDDWIWNFIQRQHEEWPIFFNFRYSRDFGEEVLRPSTLLSSLIIWDYYLNEDLATGFVHDLDLFAPSYRNKTSVVYEPLLRHGFNNSHVEFMYAVLGLKEGDDAEGWRSLWQQAMSHTMGISVSDSASMTLTSPGQHPSLLASTRNSSDSLEYLVSCDVARQTALKEHRKITLSRLDKRRTASAASGMVAEEGMVGTGGTTAGGVVSGGGGGPQLATIAESSGLVGSTGGSLFANPHQWAMLGSTVAKKCNYCDHMVVGLGARKSIVTCTVCHYICHEKCANRVPKTCRQRGSGLGADHHYNYQPSQPLSSGTTALPTSVTTSHHPSGPDTSTVISSRTPSLSSGGGELPSTPGHLGNNGESNHQLAPTSNNNAASGNISLPSSPLMGINSGGRPNADSPVMQRCISSMSSHDSSSRDSGAFYRGLLYKQDHRKILPQWKPRFFLLDSVRHNLRYYDSDVDSTVRGTIDLQHVRNVRIVRYIATGNRKFPENAYFEVEVANRTFRFATEDSKSAQDWVERIKNLIS